MLSLSLDDGVSVVEELCPSGGALTFCEGRVLPAPSLSLLVEADGKSWCGEFHGDYDGVNVVVTGTSSAGEPAILVVAGGIPYLVPVDQPSEFTLLRLGTVRDVLLSSDGSVAILVGWSEIAAIDRFGERWVSERLVGDGFYGGVDVDSHVVVARGFAPWLNSEVELKVDLKTGDVLRRSEGQS